MAYFSNAKPGEKVYGLVFGKGKIKEVYPDSHYSLIVEFDNGYEVPYTDEGIPGWGNFNKQTLFYRIDIDLSKEDFSPIDKILSPRKIIRLREKGELEVRLPSGIWKSVKKADPSYVEGLLENQQFHLFRKKAKKSKKKKDKNGKKSKKS
ncbi:hypothetical protein [Nitratifractor sp.]